MVVGGPVDRNIVPGRGGLLPEFAGRRAHLVGPVGGLVEALAWPKDLLDTGAGEAAELGVCDRCNNPVARLAPREPRRWGEHSGCSRCGNECETHATRHPIVRHGWRMPRAAD